MILPEPNCSDAELSKFALSFHGYAWANGGPYELSLKLEKIATSRPEGFINIEEETDVELLRALLFWEQRGTRWSFEEADWARFYEYARAVVERLRTLEVQT